VAKRSLFYKDWKARQGITSKKGGGGVARERTKDRTFYKGSREIKKEELLTVETNLRKGELSLTKS